MYQANQENLIDVDITNLNPSELNQLKKKITEQIEDIEAILTNDKTLERLSRGVLCRKIRNLETKAAEIDKQLNKLAKEETTQEKINRVERSLRENQATRRTLEKEVDPAILRANDEYELKQLEKEYQSLNDSDRNLRDELRRLQDLQFCERLDREQLDLNNNLKVADRSTQEGASRAIRLLNKKMHLNKASTSHDDSPPPSPSKRKLAPADGDDSPDPSPSKTKKKFKEYFRCRLLKKNSWTDRCDYTTPSFDNLQRHEQSETIHGDHPIVFCD